MTIKLDVTGINSTLEDAIEAFNKGYDCFCHDGRLVFLVKGEVN